MGRPDHGQLSNDFGSVNVYFRTLAFYSTQPGPWWGCSSFLPFPCSSWELCWHASLRSHVAFFVAFRPFGKQARSTAHLCSPSVKVL